MPLSAAISVDSAAITPRKPDLGVARGLSEGWARSTGQVLVPQAHWGLQYFCHDDGLLEP